MVVIMVYDSKLCTHLFTIYEKGIPVPTSLLWSPLSQNSVYYSFIQNKQLALGDLLSLAGLGSGV